MALAQKVSDIESEIARTHKNKATESYIGILKAELAKLKREMLISSKPGSKKKGRGFEVKKSGDARVALIGFPSMGKSTLLNKLTEAYSEVAAYEFTTLTCVPGMIHHKGARIQLLDLPCVIEGAKDGRGKGRQVIAIGKTCNLILIVLDATQPITEKLAIEHELENCGVRLNKTPADISIKKKKKGGVLIFRTVATPSLSDNNVLAICKKYKISHADVTIRSNCSANDLVDVVEGNKAYIPCLYVINKIDEIDNDEIKVLSKIPNSILVSASLEWNLNGLVEKVWEMLDLIRVYTKLQGLAPNFDDPIVLPRNKSTVENFCNKIHKEIIEEFKYALVWGTSVKNTPQRVGKDHVLASEDIVQIVKKN